MPYGYTGKILKINLTKKEISIDKPSDKFYRQYFGGRNIISYYLLNETKPGMDPYDEENLLIFATGILTGVPLPGCGRNSVGAKSPVTKGYGEAEAGGFWGAELKKAGFDAVVIKGKADNPAYICVHNGRVEIRSASQLWGRPVADAHQKLQDDLNDKLVRTSIIGPAGENMVQYACIMNDITHAAGRTGMGAVMGSKNLKAIAVRGNKMPETVNPDAVKMFGKWFRDNLNDLAGWAAQMGTPGSVLMHNEMGMLPTRNFQSGTFKGAKAISGEKMHETILVGRDSCYACPVRCKLVVETKAPYNVNKVYGGPEYETLAALGSLCGVDDLAAVAKANELCNAYSLDTITTGNTIAFAMECYEKGLLSEKDCHGLQLNFGNAKAMLKLIDLIAYRKGIGDALANGIEKTAEMLGPEAKEAVLTVKGQPLPMHEPRLKQGLGLGYAISPTGADHCHNMYDEDYAPGGWGMADIEPLGIVEAQNMAEITPQKVRILVYRHFWTSLANCLVVCLFTPYPYEKQAEMVNAVTGWNTSVWELAKVGERSINMARMYSLREGLTEADDQLPSRIFKLAVGPEDDEHNTVDYKQFEEGKRLYYEMMGWDPVTGRPNTAKLYELGLDWLVHDPS